MFNLENEVHDMPIYRLEKLTREAKLIP